MTNLQPLLGHRPTVNLPLGQSRRILSGLSDVFRTATQQPRLTESLDYENIQNQVSMEYEFKRNDGTKRRFYGYTGRTMGKFFVTSVTGVITGIVAVVLGQTTEILHEWKNERLLATTVEDSLLQAWAHHMTYSILLVLAAGMLVQLWCPSAAGAGVAPVMAYLNGSFIPNLLNFKTLFTKFVGTICGCAANLAVGPEGPMVHMGACIAACISQADCSESCCSVPLFLDLCLDDAHGLETTRYCTPMHRPIMCLFVASQAQPVALVAAVCGRSALYWETPSDRSVADFVEASTTQITENLSLLGPHVALRQPLVPRLAAYFSLWKRPAHTGVAKWRGDASWLQCYQRLFYLS
mmetsp:Transcript_3538/g.8428  ORF Transcript_3538/g.8428 Transcript_3538/m.8428 type:complete len:352 (+) Transcript_3538:255-1310(+)